MAEARRWQPKVLVDPFHIGNPRKAVDIEQLRYLCVVPGIDETGCPNPAYLAAIRYQPPMSVRLGAAMDF